MGKKSKPLELVQEANPTPYDPYSAYDRMTIPEVDTDKHGDCCAVFAEGLSMDEGVSGRKRIDTQYENWGDSTVQRPRSLGSGHPTPVDEDRWNYPHREL